MSGDLSELLLRKEKSGPDPALPLVAAMPALRVLANLLHNRKRGLNHVGAGQGLAQLHRNMKPMDGQRLLNSFAQAPGRTRIEIHQFAMQRVQRLLGGCLIFQNVGRIQSLRHRRFLFVGQMIQYVPALVNLAALDRRRFARVLFHRGSQCLAAVQNIEPGLGEVQPAIDQVAKQLTDYSGIFGGT